jgi:hypothetical protein
MATYASYKKLVTENLVDDSIPSTALASGAGSRYREQWIYNTRWKACETCANAGGCCCQYCGACCQFTVPSKVTRVTFEIWSGGGGGAGMTCCNCCSFSIGGAGGNYATKTITTAPGCQYTVCAGGSWPCNKSHTCDAGMGCRSYVTGFGLSNFCVTGGCGGWMCNGDAWGWRHSTNGCANCNICGFFDADMGMMGTVGWKPGHGACHCYRTMAVTGSPPIIGTWMSTSASDAWCVCGCFSSPPATGGMSGVSPYCDNFQKCCAGGIGGGSGIVRITYA